MTPEHSNPSKPPAAFGSWEWYLECEERSLDRLIEMTRRSAAAARAILNLKFRLIAANLPITLTAPEHAMIAADFERWAGEERDPKKAAELLRRRGGPGSGAEVQSARHCDADHAGPGRSRPSARTSTALASSSIGLVRPNK